MKYHFILCPFPAYKAGLAGHIPVNLCIENALKGKAIDPKSGEMANLVAYLKSLKGKKPAGETPKKK